MLLLENLPSKSDLNSAIMRLLYGRILRSRNVCIIPFRVSSVFASFSAPKKPCIFIYCSVVNFLPRLLPKVMSKKYIYIRFLRMIFFHSMLVIQQSTHVNEHQKNQEQFCKEVGTFYAFIHKCQQCQKTKQKKKRSEYIQSVVYGSHTKRHTKIHSIIYTHVPSTYTHAHTKYIQLKMFKVNQIK